MQVKIFNFIPAEISVMELHKIILSPTNPMHQSEAVELKQRKVLDGTVVDSVDELGFVNDASQVTVTGVANVSRSF